MSCRSRMEFCISTARGGKKRTNTGGENLTVAGVDNISSLFLHSYINRKRRGRTIQQCPRRNATTPHSKKKTIPENRIYRMPYTKKWKNEQVSNFWKYWRTSWIISSTSASQNLRNICYTYHEHSCMGFTQSSQHLLSSIFHPRHNIRRKIGKGRGPVENKKGIARVDFWWSRIL